MLSDTSQVDALRRVVKTWRMSFRYTIAVEKKYSEKLTYYFKLKKSRYYLLENIFINCNFFKLF